MKTRGGTSHASLAEPARRRFRVILGGMAGIADRRAVRLSAVPLEDRPAVQSDVPATFVRSSLGRTATISAALHPTLGALILFMGSPPSSHTHPPTLPLPPPP